MISGGLTALFVWSSFNIKRDIKKSTKEYEEKSPKYPEKEKEIAEFLKKLNNTASIENIL